jgi:ubiquinone/menaquinone biosynthesis C-methylase UbiE
MSKIVEKYCEFPTFARRPMWQIWHKLMIKFDKDTTVNFMNYGYQGLNGDTKLELNAEDESDRYCIQLYNHVVSKGELKGKDVLEVGSGRGGGASFITRYHKPKSYIGMDISASTIEYCNAHHNVDGLSFVKGHAENLPFESNRFDALVNVESARCYRDLTMFFNEVHRVLKPNGLFLFADMIGSEELDEIKMKLASCNLQIVSEKDITDNVAEALRQDSERRENQIDNKIPGFLKSSFAQFAGTVGSERYESFTNGKFTYMSFVIKPM